MMGGERSGAGERRVFLVAALVATLVFVRVDTRSVEWLLGVVPDDAFYYLQIARHIAQSGASSFDGINPTNGYHPGWMLLLVGCAKVVGDPVALLRTALAVAFALHLASSVILARALREWLPVSWAWIGGACWVLSPLPFGHAVEGMEASLYVFALALAFAVYSTRLAPHVRSAVHAIPVRDLAYFGLSLSLCAWGRTEALLLIGVVVTAFALSIRGAAGARALLVVGAVAGAAFAPWLLYSHAATGAWFQRSGAMKMLWAREAHASLGHRVVQAVRYVFEDWMAYPLFDTTTRFDAAKGALAFVVTVALVALLVRALRDANRRAATTGLVLLGTTLLTGFVYGFLFTDRQHWYRAQPGFVLFVVVYGALATWLAARSAVKRRPMVFAIAAVAFVGACLLLRVSRMNTYPWQRDVEASEPTFEALVPAGEPIGCFNAGIPAYFGHRTIVNLDGLVNNAVYPFYAHHDLADYFAQAHIAYIADEPDSLARSMQFAGRPVPLDPLASARLIGWATPTRYLWRIDSKANDLPDDP